LLINPPAPSCQGGYFDNPPLVRGDIMLSLQPSPGRGEGTSRYKKFLKIFSKIFLDKSYIKYFIFFFEIV
jgi:hypothetical protein